MHRRTIALLAVLQLAFQAPPKAPRNLLDAAPKAASREVTVVRAPSGVTVSLAPGENAYPGVGLPPQRRAGGR